MVQMQEFREHLVVVSVVPRAYSTPSGPIGLQASRQRTVSSKTSPYRVKLINRNDKSLLALTISSTNPPLGRLARVALAGSSSTHRAISLEKSGAIPVAA